MDPLVLAEFWWAVPAAGAAVGAGTWGVRRTGARRRIAYDAARRELRQAIRDQERSKQTYRIARIEVTRVSAERAAGRASGADVAAVKHAAQSAQRDMRAATATVKASRTRVNAERALIAKRSDPTPMARLTAAQDAVLVRWMTYETDPTLAVRYPLMSDVRAPAVSAFLGALDRAQQARPADPTARVSADEYIAYRDAVAHLEQSFAAAERAARIAAGEQAPPTPGWQAAGWQDAAQQVFVASADVIDRAASAAASALAAWRARRG